ncbi:hypothetical protein E4T39_04394 [Aureobasidium subglaciale]|nr:hypothetical protein E4T39_04394 [Aureobasidium subglaciale]
MASTYLYSTVWKFHEPDELITMFDGMVQDANIRCTYMSDKQMFRIEFPEPGHDNTYFKFVNLCNEYITTHQDGPLDVLSDPKIVRPPEIGGIGNVEDELDDLLREDDDSDVEEMLIDVSGGGDDEDENKDFWSPEHSSTSVEDVLPDRILQDVAQDTACSLALSVEKACVFITNASDSKIKTVKMKLYRIERTSRRPMIVSHFMRTEKEDEARVQLHRLCTLRDGTMLRTLTPVRDLDMLPRQRVIRLMRYDDKGRPQVINTPPSKYAHDERLVSRFSSMQFPQFVKDGMHAPLLTFVKDPVEVWLQKTLDSAPVGDDLMGGDLMGGDPEGGDPEDKEWHTLSPAAGHLVSQAARPVQDLGLPGETDSESRPNSSLLVDAKAHPNSDLLIDYEGRPRSPLQRCLPKYSPHTSAPGSVDIASAYSAAPTKQSQSTAPPGIKWSDKSAKASWDVIPARPTPVDYGIESLPKYVDDNSVEPFPPLGSGRQPRVQQPSTLRPSHGVTLVRPPGLSTQPGQYSQAAQTMPTEIAPDDITGIVETLQMDDEVATRKYFCTTSHRKPNPRSQIKGKPSKPSFKAQLDAPEYDPRSVQQTSKPQQTRASAPQVPRIPQIKPLVLPDCSHDLLEILENARAFRGHLDMQIPIGRFLIQGLVGPEAKEFAASKPMPARLMAKGIGEHLSSDACSHPFFVERLTSSIVEACQIPAPRLFDQGSTEEYSWYEFHCEDKYHNHLVVKVRNSEVSETTLAPNAIGQAFFHYPKRKWDACFTVYGRKPYMHHKAVAQFMEMLSVEVRDSKDGRLVGLRFRVDTDLKIYSAYAKKRISFRYVKNGRIMLHLTEVQELAEARMEEDTSLHQFASAERSTMIAEGRLWYEAKMAVDAKPFFDQNLQTNTGDDASWQPKDVLDDKMLCDIQNIVDYVVVGMDGVGVLNKGWRGDEKDMAELEAYEQQQNMTGRPDCW